jgi:hypothetical protein
LKRTPRNPPPCSASSASSPIAGSTTATPRAFPFDRAMAFSVAALSVPWQLAWTMTLR